MVGVEVDLVVQDSLKALAFYNEVFGVETLEVSNFDKGLNEAVFNLFGVRFHLLDENKEYHLVAPKEGDSKPVWINVAVEDIRSTLRKAMDHGAALVQDIVEMPEMGISNAIFADPFGHVWLLHQIDVIVSYEDRAAFLAGKTGKQN